MLSCMKSRILPAAAFVMAIGTAATVLYQPPVSAQNGSAQNGGTRTGAPKFEPDPSWPKLLLKNYMLGQVGGIYVDSHDHVWVTSRPRTLDDE